MKLYPYPRPRPHLRRRATSKGSAEVYWDHSTHIIRWLGRNALRRIHEVRGLIGRMPTVDELESWLEQHCTQAEDLDSYERKCGEAAVFALSAFDPEEHAARVERARNGGKKSKRGASYTTEQLREVESLSIAQQAAALGCSVRTVSRLRDRLKAEIEQKQDEELDALFGSEDGVEPVSEAIEERITTMVNRIPNTVPASWVDEIESVIEFERQDAESRVSAADFADIEV